MRTERSSDKKRTDETAPWQTLLAVSFSLVMVGSLFAIGATGVPASSHPPTEAVTVGDRTVSETTATAEAVRAGSTERRVDEVLTETADRRFRGTGVATDTTANESRTEGNATADESPTGDTESDRTVVVYDFRDQEEIDEYSATSSTDSDTGNGTVPGTNPDRAPDADEDAAPGTDADVAPQASDDREEVRKPWDSFWPPNTDGVVQLITNESTCSGAVVDRYHVLTAGHCVINVSTGNWKSGLGSSLQPTVVPAAGNGTSDVLHPFGSMNVTLARTYEQFADDPGKNNFDHDMALLTLDRPIGDHVSTFSYESYDVGDDPYTNKLNYLIGYPGDKQSGTMWYDYGWADGTDCSFFVVCNDLTHSANVYAWPGQSGGPITWYNSTSNEPEILSVGSVSRQFGWWEFEINFEGVKGPRLTDDRVADLDQWISEDKSGKYDTGVADRPNYGIDRWTDFRPIEPSTPTVEVPGGNDAVIAGVDPVRIETPVLNLGTAQGDSLTIQYTITPGNGPAEQFAERTVTPPEPYEQSTYVHEVVIPEKFSGEVVTFGVTIETEEEQLSNPFLSFDEAVRYLPEGRAISVKSTDDLNLEITRVDRAAGDVDSPSALTATVELGVGDNLYDSEVDDSQFDLTVGNKQVDPATVDVSRVENVDGRYRLSFMPPSQDSPGSYDFTVEFDGVANDGRSDAIAYGEGGIAQIAAALQLDRSGSMSGIIDEAIQGGVTFVQQATDEDSVSVVSYASSARVDYDLVPLADNRKGVTQAIQDLEASGSTNIGDALTSGLQSLQNAPDGAIRAGILLTDGRVTAGKTGDYEDDDGYEDREETPPYSAREKYILNEIIPKYNEQGVCLYTIGFTEDADELFMQDVAEASDCGYYTFAGESGEVENIRNTLTTVFSDIQDDVADADTMESDDGTIDAGDTTTNQFGVDETVTRTTANIRLEGADLSGLSASGSGSTIQTDDVTLASADTVALLRPDGSVVDGSDPDVDVSIVGDSVIYRIENPAPGQWTYEIQNTLPDPTEYTVDVTGGAQATMDIATAGEQYYVGDETDITATLFGPDGGISGATVEATVTHPDGTTSTVTLDERSPGIYAGTVGVDETGTYTATVRAEKGTLSRLNDVSWTVSGTPPLSITQSTAPTILQGESGTFDLLVDPMVSGSGTTTATSGSPSSTTVSLVGETTAGASSAPTADDAFFEVLNLDPQRVVVESGETIQPGAFIRNTGNESGEQVVEYRIDGKVYSDGTVQLDRGEEGRLGLENPVQVDLPPGEYTHGFYTENDSTTGTLVVQERIVLGTSDFEAVSHDGTIPRSAVTLDTKVLTGTQATAIPTTVSVPEGTPPGDYVGKIQAIRDDGTVVTETVTLTVTQTPSFELALDDTNAPVSEGESLKLTVSVHNTGDVAGTQTIEVVVPGLGTDTATVSLGPGANTVETLTVPTVAGLSGEYEVTITSNDDTVTTTVVVEDDGGPLSEYTDEEGIVRDAGLNKAVGDYLEGELSAADLNTIIESYLLEEPIS